MLKYKRLSDGFIMTQEQANRFWNWQYYYLTAEERGVAIWQRAFDNVLDGVDEEIIEELGNIAAYMRWDYPDDFYFPGYRDNEYEFAKWENELPF